MGINRSNDSDSGSFDLTGFIRSLQRVEGNVDCFKRANNECNQLDCAWRHYCLEDVEEFND